MKWLEAEEWERFVFQPFPFDVFETAMLVLICAINIQLL